MYANTPVQGTATDLIKVAIIRIDEKLRGMQTRMLLQVHGELCSRLRRRRPDAK